MAVACGSSRPAAGTDGSTAADANLPAASQTIGAHGGVLATPAGELRVDIPAGAVDHDVAFSIERLPAPPNGAVGPAFEIGPTGTQFLTPVRLTFALAPADAPGAVVSQLAVAVRQGDAWTLLADEAVDAVARTVSATTTHLSTYGLIVSCRPGDGIGRIAGADVSDLQVSCQAPPPPGSLDPSFGSGGLVFSPMTPIGDTGGALAIDAGGRILVVGGVIGANGVYDFALARFTSDGRPDPSFGAGGIATADLGGDDQARGLSIQRDGNIVVAGSTSVSVSGIPTRFSLARFLPNGSLDPAFGAGGRVSTDLGNSFSEVAAVAIQPDGRIVVAGTTQTMIALARYLSDGSLDPTFGAGGWAAPAIAGGARARTMGLLGDGRIAVAGSLGAGGGVARYDSSGALDPSFGTAGVLVTVGIPVALAVQPDDKLVLGGSQSGPAGDSDFRIVRLDSHGAPDLGFGNQGATTVDFPAVSDDDTVASLVLDAGGSIIAVGTTADRTRSGNVNADFALARLTPSGALDATFGTAGRYVQDFFAASDVAIGAALAPGGALVVSGGVRSGTTLGFGLLRLLP